MPGVRSTNTHVALLRGINVGGKNRLPMKELAAIFEGAGCVDVKTLIQSGNVVFEAPRAKATRVGATVAAVIAERFGYRVPVIVRTAAELATIASDNPLLCAGAERAALHVVFLSSEPNAAGLAALDPKRSTPDTFIVRRSEIYLHLPNGTARTKLSNDYFDRTLQTTSTMRNWRTVLRLVELAGASP